MSLAFLHGGEAALIALVVVVLAVCAAVAVAVWWWRHPPKSPITPTAVYVFVATSCLLLWGVEPSRLPPLSWLGFLATLPWSILYFMVGGSFFGDDIPAWPLLAGVAVNAALLYAAAKLARKHREGDRDAGSMRGRER